MVSCSICRAWGWIAADRHSVRNGSKTPPSSQCSRKRRTSRSPTWSCSEAAVAASGWLLLWFAIFFACLATFIRFWEEPHLVQRYGSEYVNYRENVPAWMPRILARTPSA